MICSAVQSDRVFRGAHLTHRQGPHMSLQGYGPLLLNGTWQTVKLAVLSLTFAFVLGLLGAAAKLSKNRVSSSVGTLYTTLVRGVPDLVLMLLLFYSLQIWLNDLTNPLGLDQFNLNPLPGGVTPFA